MSFGPTNEPPADARMVRWEGRRRGRNGPRTAMPGTDDGCARQHDPGPVPCRVSEPQGDRMAAGVPPSALAGNLVLGPLPEADRTRLAHRVTPYKTDHEVLVAAGGTIPRAWFPTSGLISVVAALKDGKRAEVATVGREGMAGLPLFLGSRSSLYEIVAQVSGEGFSLPADEFVEEVGQSPALRERLLRYSEARMAMLGQTAACNAAHPI